MSSNSKSKKNVWKSQLGTLVSNVVTYLAACPLTPSQSAPNILDLNGSAKNRVRTFFVLLRKRNGSLAFSLLNYKNILKAEKI